MSACAMPPWEGWNTTSILYKQGVFLLHNRTSQVPWQSYRKPSGPTMADPRQLL